MDLFKIPNFIAPGSEIAQKTKTSTKQRKNWNYEEGEDEMEESAIGGQYYSSGRKKGAGRKSPLVLQAIYDAALEYVATSVFRLRLLSAAIEALGQAEGALSDAALVATFARVESFAFGLDLPSTPKEVESQGWIDSAQVGEERRVPQVDPEIAVQYVECLKAWYISSIAKTVIASCDRLGQLLDEMRRSHSGLLNWEDIELAVNGLAKDFLSGETFDCLGTTELGETEVKKTVEMVVHHKFARQVDPQIAEFEPFSRPFYGWYVYSKRALVHSQSKGSFSPYFSTKHEKLERILKQSVHKFVAERFALNNLTTPWKTAAHQWPRSEVITESEQHFFQHLQVPDTAGVSTTLAELAEWNLGSAPEMLVE
ncbi:hypothetical protein HDU93_007334 [Gonapodya sp. JEL0774]|nr:hypothetical protein HDU93_007334 [Gonapodya sp. JEL0774]